MRIVSPKRPKESITLLSLLDLVIIAWALELIDQFILSGWLDSLGIRPRSLSGLIGIPLMPWLHGNLTHLSSNTVPFLILGYITLKAEGRRFYATTLAIILLGGLGTWLIAGSNEIHIGASGLVYGYFGYVMTRAFLEKRLLWVVIGIFVALFYGSLIFGIIPNTSQPISWEGHLTGMLAGIWIGRRRSAQQP